MERITRSEYEKRMGQLEKEISELKSMEIVEEELEYNAAKIYVSVDNALAPNRKFLLVKEAPGFIFRSYDCSSTGVLWGSCGHSPTREGAFMTEQRRGSVIKEFSMLSDALEFMFT